MPIPERTSPYHRREAFNQIDRTRRLFKYHTLPQPRLHKQISRVTVQPLNNFKVLARLRQFPLEPHHQRRDDNTQFHIRQVAANTSPPAQAE